MVRAVSDTGRGYGWKPQIGDRRDYRLVMPQQAPPEGVFSLRDWLPATIFDQGALGSCVGNGVALTMMHARKEAGLPDDPLSRLFIYYYARALEGTTREDAGAAIRDGIRVVAKQGAPPEALWPYLIAKYRVRPTAAAQRAGRRDVAITYRAVAQSRLDLRAALYAGRPIVFGMAVYASFESPEVARTGIVPLPAKGEAVVGGHCTVLCGYDDDRQLYEGRNSWGAAWGDHGHYWIPYELIHDPQVASDFWVIDTVRGTTGLAARLAA